MDCGTMTIWLIDGRTFFDQTLLGMVRELIDCDITILKVSLKQRKFMGKGFIPLKRVEIFGVPC